jgi:hypothetical protein
MTSATWLMRASIASMLCLLWGASARADTPPSQWDIARDPAERDRWALHLRVERLVHPPRPDDATPLDSRQDDELRLEAARVLLEEADAAHSPDVRLRFDLGAIYERLATTEKRNDLQQKVIDVLGPALDGYADSPSRRWRTPMRSSTGREKNSRHGAAMSPRCWTTESGSPRS